MRILMSKKKKVVKKKTAKKEVKKGKKKMPFGFDDNKPKVKEDKISDTTYDPIVDRTESLFSNEEKLGMITSVLKGRMNPRELNDAVREIKTILEF